jgi:two-component system, NtrC family, response regulator HydG
MLKPNRDTTLLIIDDEKPIRESLHRTLRQEEYQVRLAENGAQGLRFLEAERIDLAVVDMVLPDWNGVDLLKKIKSEWPEVEVVLVTAYGTIETAVEAMKYGAYDFLTKPFKQAQILNAIKKALEKFELEKENRLLKEQLSEQTINRKLVGTSPEMMRLKKMIQQVAPSSATVFIQGESGTGKEVVAETIHYLSARASRPVVKVNCAALPETLLEAELFGYEKGAFTGAFARKEGRFDLARGGTLFLDEIGDMPLATQVKLLRVLQDGTYERLGGTETLEADVRIIAATHHDLEQDVKSKRFREDLYYRINVIALKIPPLRERTDEIPILANHFLKIYATKNGKKVTGFTESAINALTSYEWPGNVRQLENVVERAVVLTETEVITPAVFPREISGVKSQIELESNRAPVLTISFPIGTSMDDIENRVIHSILEYTQGNKQRAAQLLNLASKTIHRRLVAENSTEVVGVDTTENSD